MKKKLLIVDDHPIVLNGLKAMIKNLEDYELVAALLDPTLVINYLNSIEVDLVITDLEMPQMHGIELINQIKKKSPKIKILVLTMLGERSKLDEAVSLGVDGYLLKDSDKEELVFALKSIFRGRQFFSSSLIETGILKQEKSKPEPTNDGLTEREVEVLKMIAEGFSNIEIAEQLFLSPKTIDNHRTNIMRKLEVHNVVQLVRYAIKNKIISIS